MIGGCDDFADDGTLDGSTTSQIPSECFNCGEEELTQHCGSSQATTNGPSGNSFSFKEFSQHKDILLIHLFYVIQGLLLFMGGILSVKN